MIIFYYITFNNEQQFELGPEPLDRLLPDNYNIDYNIHRYSVDKVFFIAKANIY
jgi:hypothetical protein